MTGAAKKIAALEALARDPGAAPGERQNARTAAARLRAREPASAPGWAPPPPPPPASSGRVEHRGGVAYWVGAPPVHGRRCRQTVGGCPDCEMIAAWREWLRGQK